MTGYERVGGGVYPGGVQAGNGSAGCVEDLHLRVYLRPPVDPMEMLRGPYGMEWRPEGGWTEGATPERIARLAGGETVDLIQGLREGIGGKPVCPARPVAVGDS